MNSWWTLMSDLLAVVGVPAVGVACAGELKRWFVPSPQYAGELGAFRSPLVFGDGRRVGTVAEWRKRRQEILQQWHAIMGPWPPLIPAPRVEWRESTPREHFVQHRVRIEVAPGGRTVDGYLLVPEEARPMPAVVVPCYDAETGAGLGKPLGDFGYQLARRGFVALSIGTPECRYYPSKDNVQLQPLSMLAYVAANCYNALATLPEVDAERVGIVGHSYGGKWAMFASCLYEKFACAVWSDPGIVFDEKRPNVNYWEPWYLGYDPDSQRRPGVPSPENPRTGAYKRLVEAGHDLHELHALMAPRPFLVSGGSEDQPGRWAALNHTIAVNRLLGYTDRVAMTNRPGHSPTPESNEEIYAFFERFLKKGAARKEHSTDRLRQLRRGPVVLCYSPESEPVAEGLAEYAARCNRYLAGLFRPNEAVCQTVHWLSRRDWRGAPESYGFPHATGPDAVLAAADVDLPDQLAEIAKAMDIPRGGPAVERVARLLELPEPWEPADVYRELSGSKHFFFIYSAYFILPHELTHGFCNHLNYPQQPRWYYEGLAQWAAYCMHKELRSQREGELIYAYYQLLWDRDGRGLRVRDFARADRLGPGGLDTPNYAWYHAGLLRMFRELEAMKGGGFLPELVRSIGQKHRGQAAVGHEAMVETFSQVVGRDLGDWFRRRWNLGR
ncbi:MAG TPA: hypothetical protein EYP56_09050 [Planctomycetaceae bacterium]|nr:hypothetical protein [Planctomycetaceae bacterium]HIQ22994.1 hypothetical protein [Planctomycetota bacterium]